MDAFEFKLTFRLADASADPANYVQYLYQNGCDDSNIGISKQRSLIVNFIREGDTAQSAILSAIADVRTAIPNIRLVEASPDLVNTADMAEFLNCSRKAARRLIEQDATTPLPVHEGTPALWHLADLLIWLTEVKPHSLEDSDLLEVATVNKLINTGRDLSPDCLALLPEIQAKCF